VPQDSGGDGGYLGKYFIFVMNIVNGKAAASHVALATLARGMGNLWGILDKVLKYIDKIKIK
jgi:hypothetical protein